MRLIEQHPQAEPLRIDPARQVELVDWLTAEIEDAFAARADQEASWRDSLRMYEGVPKNPIRNVPIENAPNTEITLGAIACDSLYASVLDLIYNISPIVTARATNARFVEHAKRIQRFSDYVVINESNLRHASENAFLDDIQLGTGIYYIPWVNGVKKTKSMMVRTRGPRVFPLPVEDYVVPGGSYAGAQAAQWCGVRTWLTEGQLALRAKLRGWNTDGFVPRGSVDWVRSQRERLGRTSSGTVGATLYEIIDIYCYYDIDGDGQDEDLLITYDRVSRGTAKIIYNPYDRRPIEDMVYQRRAHLAYGLGVLEMIRPYEEEASEEHNHRVLNMLLANSRFFVARAGSVPEGTRVWPGKVQEVDDLDNFRVESLADVYPSAAQSEAITIAMAERRVGVNDLSLPRPSSVLGSRTPGITAISMLQQVNKRFAPAFDQMRMGTGNAVKQCLFRYQEKLLAGDPEVERHINEVMGPADAQLIIAALRDQQFDDGVAVELTASSASVNREADRQSAIILANLLGTYYQRTLELVAIASNPATPPPVRDVAGKIAASAGELIERTLRTFDSVRDPEAFVINMEEELDQIQGLNSQGMLGLAEMVNGLGAAANGAGPAPPEGAQ
jgi:hypothetical protein